MADHAINSRNVSDGRDTTGFVEVMFAQSTNEASVCRTLLEERNIPAVVENVAAVDRRQGIAVLVPPNRLVEASELLATNAQDHGDQGDRLSDQRPDDEEDFGVEDDDDDDDSECLAPYNQVAEADDDIFEDDDDY